MEPLLDKPIIDLEEEIKSIEDGRKEIKSSRLFEFLSSTNQMKVSSASQLRQIYKLTNSTPFLNNTGIVKENQFGVFIKISKIVHKFTMTEEKKLLFTKDYCALNTAGTYNLSTLSMLLLLKRYHSRLGLPDFLCCFIKIENEKVSNCLPLFRQMISSRTNFVLNGNYLPILVSFLDEKHLTSMLVFPVFQSNELKWHFININSNGLVYKYRFEYIPLEAMKYYEKYVAHQKDNKTSHVILYCNSKIQRDFGTCGYWGMLLLFCFFADINDLLTKIPEFNFIAEFCEYLARMNQSYIVINRFHTYIIDLIYSCYQLTLETYVRAANPSNKTIIKSTELYNPPIFADSGLPLIPSIPQFGHEILYSDEDAIVKLNIVILDLILQTQSRLRKKIDKFDRKLLLKKRMKETPSKAIQNELEGFHDTRTDEETEIEQKTRREKLIEEGYIKSHESKCDTLQHELIHLKEKIEEMEQQNEPQSNINELKRKFAEKFNQMSEKIEELPLYYDDVWTWLEKWFKKVSKDVISNLQREIKKEKKEENIDLMRKQLLDLNNKFQKFEYRKDAKIYEDFVRRMISSSTLKRTRE
jgi:hypothetical protein